MAPTLTVDCQKRFSGVITIAAEFVLPLDPPQVLILFGPSGSGKTTVLRCLAGLEEPDSGRIQFGDLVWCDVQRGVRQVPQRRSIGYLPQDYALFPHLSVRCNIEYGLSELSNSARARRVEELVALFHLEGLAHRMPGELSGGQQQRVGLARAVARHPGLLLLDEPLSALDAPVRAKIQGELRMLLKQLGIPAVVVTHDWAEALALGDRLVVMSHGRMVQQGSPQSVFSRPVNQEVARVVGVDTVVPGRVVDETAGLMTVEVAGRRLTAVAGEGLGAAVFACIRAEDVILESVGSGVTSARNHLAGVVSHIQSVGALARVQVDCGFSLAALVTRSALHELGLQAGTPVRAAIKAGAIHLVPRQDGAGDEAAPVNA